MRDICKKRSLFYLFLFFLLKVWWRKSFINQWYFEERYYISTIILIYGGFTYLQTFVKRWSIILKKLKKTNFCLLWIPLIECKTMDRAWDLFRACIILMRVFSIPQFPTTSCILTHWWLSIRKTDLDPYPGNRQSILPTMHFYKRCGSRLALIRLESM